MKLKSMRENRQMEYNEINCCNCKYYSYNRNSEPCCNCTESQENEERAPYDVPLKFYFEPRFKVYDGKLIEQIPSFNVFF